MKNWMITGVSTGLGRALAEAALNRGDRVAGTVRNDRAAQAFAALAPGRALPVLMDITDETAVTRTVADVEQATGGIDILVNNAGYGLVGAVEETTLAEARAQFDVNLFGVLATLRAALPFLRARRAGHIINVTSVSGLVGWPSLGVYSASKFALEGLTETLAMEVAPLGIKVTMIEPGGFRTDFATRSRASTASLIDDYDATVGESRRLLAEHAGHEPGDPVKAAEAILSIAGIAEPPLRLLLGSDALRYAGYKFDAQSAEIKAWEKLTVSTDITEE